MNHNYQKPIELMICLLGERRKGNKGGDENPSLPLFGWTKVRRGDVGEIIHFPIVLHFLTCTIQPEE